MSMLDLHVDNDDDNDDFKFNVQHYICDAVRSNLKNRKSGCYFQTDVVRHKVQNIFIERLLSHDLKNYCIEKVDTIFISIPGSKVGNLPNQVFQTHRQVPCKRSRIFLCEPYLLNHAFGAQYWHIVPQVLKNDNLIGKTAAIILSGDNGSIVLTYNWRTEELIISGHISLEFVFFWI